jgi:hypothetical protein
MISKQTSSNNNGRVQRRPSVTNGRSRTRRSVSIANEPEPSGWFTSMVTYWVYVVALVAGLVREWFASMLPGEKLMYRGVDLSIQFAYTSVKFIQHICVACQNDTYAEVNIVHCMFRFCFLYVHVLIGITQKMLG